MQTWLPIRGYEGYYEISNDGEVKSLARTILSGNRIKEHFVKSSISNKGYEMVHFSKNGIGKTCSVHRLVAEHFIKNPLKKPQVNHKDSDKLNNRVENLEWVTAKENTAHFHTTNKFKELSTSFCGENNPNSKLKSWQVFEIKDLINLGFPLVYIASQFGVSAANISDIKSGRRWKGVDLSVKA